MRTEVDLAEKDAEEAIVNLGAVRIELGEVNKKLLAAENKDVTNLQEEREVLWTLFHRLEEEKKAKEEELGDEANPKENFEYLNESKDMFLEYYTTQAAYEEFEATPSTSPTDQRVEVPPVQTNDPPAPVDPVDLHKEPGTTAVRMFLFLSLFYLFGL
uniref:Uncharacterized protein n=1 Tax=Cannabis sativa TaxID=3483 RepID=A0A803PC95_CANSA